MLVDLFSLRVLFFNLIQQLPANIPIRKRKNE